MDTTDWRRWLARRLRALAVGLLAFGTGVPGALSDELGPDPTASPGWASQIFMPDLYHVDNVVIDDRGDMYATIESQSQGRIVRLDGGKPVTVLAGLHRPDGLAIKFPYLYITEEMDNGRVTRLDLTSLSKTILTNLGGPEGIDFLRDGSLIIAEDHGGRVMRVTMAGESQVIVDRLSVPEGLAVSSDGTVFIAETDTGRILALSDQGITTVLEGLNFPDQVEIAADGALWISEDAKPGRLLRYESGHLEVVMTGLMSPQGIAFGKNGEVYVSEQDRNRILVLKHITPTESSAPQG